MCFLSLSVATIEAPVITNVVRFGPTSVNVQFEVPPNEQVELEHFVVDLYNSTGNKNLDLLVCCIQTVKKEHS